MEQNDPGENNDFSSAQPSQPGSLERPIEAAQPPAGKGKPDAGVEGLGIPPGKK